jgi:tRNA pseudouridine55 synthase
MPVEELSGILNINKAAGLSSHDVVARLRRIIAQRRVGHAGTLDPLAAGVLLLCVGQATRVAEYLMSSEKTYEARIRLGIETDTYDAEGQIVREVANLSATRKQVQHELGAMVGTIEQTPPMYSAIKKEGAPLYRLARRGQTVPRQPRSVQIHELQLLDWAPPDLAIRLRCSKGTYVRSLAHDLGQRLGCGAHVLDLTRTASGQFLIDDAITIEAFEQLAASGRAASVLQPLDAALQSFPAATVDQDTARAIALGQSVHLTNGTDAAMLRAYDQCGQLLALLRQRGNGFWQPHKVFIQPVSHENRP